MNPKLEKVSADIGKLKSKIAALQSRLREMERQKTELENAEIVAIFRKEKLNEDEFSAFLQEMSRSRAKKQDREEIKNNEE